MPAKVTIYNDSSIDADIEVTYVPGHPKAVIERKHAEASEDPPAHMFDLEFGDVLIVRRVGNQK